MTDPALSTCTFFNSCILIHTHTYIYIDITIWFLRCNIYIYMYIYIHTICTTNCTKAKVCPKHVHQLLHICDDLSFGQVGCLRFAMMMNPILLIFETREQKQHVPQLMNKNPVQNRGFDWGYIRGNKILGLFPLYSQFSIFHYIPIIFLLYPHYSDIIVSPLTLIPLHF
jgi:hypothetical protein